jgi:hypothetical protein
VRPIKGASALKLCPEDDEERGQSVTGREFMSYWAGFSAIDRH